jgi:hypothetical protein
MVAREEKVFLPVLIVRWRQSIVLEATTKRFFVQGYTTTKNHVFLLSPCYS